MTEAKSSWTTFANGVSRTGTMLSSEEVTTTLGFTSGFVWATGTYGEMFQEPLSQTFWGSVVGTVTGFGSYVVHRMMPDKLKFIPSGLMVGSVAVALVKKLHRRDQLRDRSWSLLIG